MGGLHIHNWATGKSVHLVVYAGESISRFICHSGAVPRPANHTFPFPDWFSSSSVFINFSLFLRKRKLTAVCSHQTRIGNLDAHLI